MLNCDPMDYSLPGSPVHRIFQASILEWVAISFSKASSLPGDQTCNSCVSCTGRSLPLCNLRSYVMLINMKIQQTEVKN